MLKLDGYDDAIAGKTEVWVPNKAGMVLVEKLIYDGEVIIDNEAEEFVSFNVEGAYMGPETPIIYWPYFPEH